MFCGVGEELVVCSGCWLIDWGIRRLGGRLGRLGRQGIVCVCLLGGGILT